MIPVISYIDNYTKKAINHDLEHSSITNCFLIVLYHVVQLRFDNSQYTNMLCYVMLLHCTEQRSVRCKKNQNGVPTPTGPIDPSAHGVLYR